MYEQGNMGAGEYMEELNSSGKGHVISANKSRTPASNTEAQKCSSFLTFAVYS